MGCITAVILLTCGPSSLKVAGFINGKYWSRGITFDRGPYEARAKLLGRLDSTRARSGIDVEGGSKRGVRMCIFVARAPKGERQLTPNASATLDAVTCRRKFWLCFHRVNKPE